MVGKNSRQENGYIALLAVLIVGAVALAISLGVLLTSTDIQRSVLIEQQSAQARSLARACAEEGLQQIHDNNNFTGTNTLTLGQGSCTYTVTTTGSSTRSIASSGIINNVVRKCQVYATIGSSSISITSWQEVM